MNGSKAASFALIQWSAQSVLKLDPISHGLTEIAGSGHDFVSTPTAVVAVSPRSVFIRSIHVPNVSRDEATRILALKLSTELPLNASEYVFGFRLGNPLATGGRTAVVGAIKTESLRNIYRKAAEMGVSPNAVLPLAFGSWFAAQAHGLSNCAVVHKEGETLNIDLIVEGELRYSRSVPTSESLVDIHEEIDRTFTIAGVHSSPILAMATLDITSAYQDPKHPIEYLTDLHAIDRQLFTWELPEKIAKRASQQEALSAQRAIGALVLAVCLAVLAYSRQATAATSAATESRTQVASLNQAIKQRGLSETASRAAVEAKKVLTYAFQPAQRFTDVIHELTAASTADAWFTGLTLERGKPLVVRGDALNEKAIAIFVAKLAKNPRFRSMKLLFANQSKIEKKQIVQFAVSGFVVGNVPLDKPIPAKVTR